MIRCLAVLIRLVDQQFPIPVVEIAGEIGVGLGMIRRGPRRHGHKTTDCQAAVVEIPAGVVPVVHFWPGILQKSLDVSFVIPAVPQEEDLPGNAGGGAQLIFPVAVQVDGLAVSLGPGQQVGRSAVVQIVVIRDGVDVAAPTRPAGEIVRIGHRKAAVTQQIVEEEQPNIVGIIPAVQRRDGEKYVGLPLGNALLTAYHFRPHDCRVDCPVCGAVNPERISFAAAASNREAAAPLRTVIGMAGQGHLLGLIGGQAIQGKGHPGVPLRPVIGRGNILVRQQVGHEPILPVPPVQQGDALGIDAAVVEVFPVELDIVAHPLAVAEGDGTVVGIAVDMVVGVKLLDIPELIPIDPLRLIQRQANIIKEERVDLR